MKVLRTSLKGGKNPPGKCSKHTSTMNYQSECALKERYPLWELTRFWVLARQKTIGGGYLLLSYRATMKPIKVLPVIEVNLIANIFSEVLEGETDIAVVGCPSTSEEALKIIQEQEVDLALISVSLPDQNALALTRAIMDHTPATKVLVLGLADDVDDVLKYIEAGAAGYILKDSSLQDLIETMRSIQRGEAHVSARMAGAMIERLSGLARMFSAVEDSINGEVRLTPRELEVLRCIDQGRTNQEIAALLLVEIGTVKNHVHSILEKLNVKNRVEAASYLTFLEK